MPQVAVDEFGQRFVITDDGRQIPAPELEGNLFGDETDVAQMIEFQSAIRGMGRTLRGLAGADRDTLRLEQQEEDALLEGLRLERPIATTIGGALPFGLTTGGVGGGMATSVGLGALEGFLDFDADEVSQLRSTAEGGLTGLAGDIAGRMAGRVVNGIRSIGRAVRETSPAAQRVEEVGGRVTAGQRLNDPTVRSLEASLSGDAMTNRVFEEIGDHNQRLVNSRAGAAIGVDTDVIDEAALDQAAQSLERVFKAVSKHVGRIDMGPEFGERTLALEQFRKLRQLGDLPNLQQGVLTGNEVTTVRQALSEEMGRAFEKGQGQLGNRIRGMIELLDGRIEGAIGEEGAEQFARAREAWNVLRVLEGTNVVSGGNVNTQTLNRRLRSTFGTSATRGRGDQLNNQATRDLVEATAALSDPRVRPIVPTSGTAERMAVREAINNPAGAVARGLAAGPIRAVEDSPRAASIIGALIEEQSPLIFRQAGRQAAIGSDPLDLLISGQ